jgi:hypothetical protein
MKIVYFKVGSSNLNSFVSAKIFTLEQDIVSMAQIQMFLFRRYVRMRQEGTWGKVGHLDNYNGSVHFCENHETYALEIL